MYTRDGSVYELFFVVVLTIGGEVHQSLYLVHVYPLLLDEGVLHKGQEVNEGLDHLGAVSVCVLSQQTVGQSGQNVPTLPGYHTFIQVGGGCLVDLLGQPPYLLGVIGQTLLVV